MGMWSCVLSAFLDVLSSRLINFCYQVNHLSRLQLNAQCFRTSRDVVIQWFGNCNAWVGFTAWCSSWGFPQSPPCCTAIFLHSSTDKAKSTVCSTTGKAEQVSCNLESCHFAAKHPNVAAEEGRLFNYSHKTVCTLLLLKASSPCKA